MEERILDGVTVLDLTRVLCGPYATMHLGDMGADVIKIENREHGDDTRATGVVLEPDFSAYFVQMNRNKRCVTLNLKTPEGRALFLELAKKADVVVENFRPGVTRKLGIAYEDVRAVKPDIIYASASGFGSQGPYAQRAGYDAAAQAMGGVVACTGPKEGGMYRAGIYVADVMTGLNLEVGILGALRLRDRTGRGQYLEVALLDSVVSAAAASYNYFYGTGKLPPRYANDDPFNAPFSNYKASDGEFLLGAGNPKLFHLSCQALAMPELETDPRFDTAQKRMENSEVLRAIIEDWARDKTVDQCVQILVDYGVPTAPVWTMDRIFRDEHLRKWRKVFVPTPYGHGRQMDTVASPIQFSESPMDYRLPPAALGQHNKEIYGGLLGLDNETLADYAAREII